MYVTYPERAMLGLGARPPWTLMQKRQKGGKKKANIMDAYAGIKEALIGISASRRQGQPNICGRNSTGKRCGAIPSVSLLRNKVS